MMEEKQPSMMHVMREMVAEFTRNNDRSESSRAEGRAAVAGSPRGAEPIAARETSIAARETSIAAAAGGVARGETTAGRWTTLREDASRNLGVTGRRESAVLVEVDPATGQPDKPWRAGECDASPGGELRWDKRRSAFRQRSRFLVYLRVGSTTVNSRMGNGYRELGAWQGVQPRKCAHAYTGVEFIVDDSQEQE